MTNNILYYISRILPDSIYLRLRYFQRTGRRLHLHNPKTFNEKLQWLKLYDRKPQFTRMVDKAEAKKYVAGMIGEQYIVPTYGVYDSAEEIDFDSLPNQFVLKCTHDSGGIIICRDKSTLDKEAVLKKLRLALSSNYYWRSREWPYKNVRPRIIAEKYLGEMMDYKFYCFDGVPKLLYVSQGLENHKTATISFLTIEWKYAPFKRSDYEPFPLLPPKPSKYDEMLEVAKKLSSGFPFIRVDLYQVKESLYFSELTFSPCGGVMPFDPPEWDEKLGEWLSLPQSKYEKN